MSYTYTDIATGVGILGVLGLGYYGYGYVKDFGQRYINNQVMSQLNDKMEKEGEPFITLGNDSALITFTHGGKQHHVTTQYSRLNARGMNRKMVYLIDADGNKKDITHKPGIPYNLSPKDMVGVEIVVEKDDQILHKYDLDEIPKYLN